MNYARIPFLIFISIAGFTPAAGETGMFLRNFLSASINEYYYHYSEIFDENTLGILGINKTVGTPKSDEYGLTTLMSLDGTRFQHSRKWYTGAGIGFGRGKHLYDGSSQITDTSGPVPIMVYQPFKAKKNNYFLQFHLLTGPCFSRDRFFLGFRSGVEYRIWYRHLFNMTEKYAWLYLPFNLQAALERGEESSLGCSITYRMMLSGTMQMEPWSEQNSSEIPPLDLGKKQGFLIEFPYKGVMNHILGFECKPWFEYRPFGRSNVDTIIEYIGGEEQTSRFLEPASESYSIGCTFSLLIGSFIKRKGPVR